MENKNFEAYAFIGFDHDNEEYTEDYPHEIVAHVNDNIETWKTKCIGQWFIKYYRAKTERYTKEAWHKCLANPDANSTINDMTQEDFKHYAYSGSMFG